MTQAFQYLELERRGHVCIVRFNRPECCNAVNYDLLTEIEACAFGFRDDAETRVVIFTGVATPVEAAGIGTFGAIFVAAMHRRLSWPATPRCPTAWSTSR